MQAPNDFIIQAHAPKAVMAISHQVAVFQVLTLVDIGGKLHFKNVFGAYGEHFVARLGLRSSGNIGAILEAKRPETINAVFAVEKPVCKVAIF
jgi:hypothetical protein